MGSAGREPSPEDEACADYLEHLLTGRPYDHALTLRHVVAHEATQKFLRGDQPHYPSPDPIYCLQRDLFDFVLVAVQEEGGLIARRVDVPPICPGSSRCHAGPPPGSPLKAERAPTSAAFTTPATCPG